MLTPFLLIFEICGTSAWPYAISFCSPIDTVGFCTEATGSIWMTGFEPATPCSQSRCSAKLSHIQIYSVRLMSSWFTMDTNPFAAEFLTPHTTSPASPKLSWGLWIYIPHQNSYKVKCCLATKRAVKWSWGNWTLLKPVQLPENKLGYPDLNWGMQESKSCALPLGDSPL